VRHAGQGDGEPPDRARLRRKRVLLTGLLAASGAAFAALGLWQIERRTEKLALIAAVEHRAHAPPAAAPGPVDWPRIGFRTDAYRHVRARGVYDHDRETLVQAATRLGPGYWVMTPLTTEAGWTVLVNRGFVTPEQRGRAGRREGEPRGPVTVTGLLRISEPAGGFLRDNDPARDRWYSRDVAGIGRARDVGPLAPYFIDAEASGGEGRQPVGGLTVLSFPNNHLQNAMTWYAHAALAAFGLARIWRGGGSDR
jgi:surfeit locus 1 family protein